MLTACEGSRGCALQGLGPCRVQSLVRNWICQWHLMKAFGTTDLLTTGSRSQQHYGRGVPAAWRTHHQQARCPEGCRFGGRAWVSVCGSHTCQGGFGLLFTSMPCLIPCAWLGLAGLHCWGCEGQAEPSGGACVPPEGYRGAQSPAQVSRGLPHTAGHPGLCGPGTAVLDQGGLPPLISKDSAALPRKADGWALPLLLSRALSGGSSLI